MGQKCQYLAQNDQKCIFWTKFGFFGPNILILTGGSKSVGTHVMEKPPWHLVRIGFWWALRPNGPKMLIFWLKAKFCRNGPKILIFTGVRKGLGNHIMEKPPRELVRIVFWPSIRSNGPKMPIFGHKYQFWAKFGSFWAKNPFFFGGGVKLLVSSYQGTN